VSIQGSGVKPDVELDHDDADRRDGLTADSGGIKGRELSRAFPWRAKEGGTPWRRSSTT